MVVITELNIGGKKREVKFCLNQSAEYCRVRGVSLAQAQRELMGVVSVLDKEGNVIRESTSTGSEARDVIYSALWAAEISNGKSVDFDRFKVGDWIDETEQSDIDKVFQALIDANDSGEVDKKKVKAGKK